MCAIELFVATVSWHRINKRSGISGEFCAMKLKRHKSHTRRRHL